MKHILRYVPSKVYPSQTISPTITTIRDCVFYNEEFTTEQPITPTEIAMKSTAAPTSKPRGYNQSPSTNELGLSVGVIYLYHVLLPYLYNS